MSCGRNCDDRRDSEVAVLSVAAENGHEPDAWISDAFATAPCPCWDVDGVGRFLLVVISVVCASHHTHRTEFQSYGMLWVADSTTDMAPGVREALDLSSVSNNWLHQLRCYYTSKDDWLDRLQSHSCSDKAYSEHTSCLISCRCHFLCSQVQMYKNLFDSILLGKIPDNIYKNFIFVTAFSNLKSTFFYLPTSQACLYHHCIILHYRLGNIKCRSFLETTRSWVASCYRWNWIIDRIVVVVHTCELNVWVVIGWNYRWLSCRRKLTICVSVVGIIWCELTRYVLNV